MSPLRVRTWISGKSSPASAKDLFQFIERAEQVTLDVIVESPQGRDIENTRISGGPLPVINWLRAHRNAARVFPLPVGAVMSRCSPAAILGQASL